MFSNEIKNREEPLVKKNPNKDKDYEAMNNFIPGNLQNTDNVFITFLTLFPQR